MPNDILQDILRECKNLNKRTGNAYAELFAKLPQACRDHPDNIDLFQPLLFPNFIQEQFVPRYSQGVLQFLKALDSQLTVPLYMHLIPELTELCYQQKKMGEEQNCYSIFFFEILSYCFKNDQILQILSDLNQCFPLVPAKYHGSLLKSMCLLVDFPLFSIARPEAFAIVMCRRLHNLAAYLLHAHTLPSLSNLGLIPTGSDPHIGGKQALFLATDSSEDPTPFLYKPRSMHPDFAVTRALMLANDTALALHAVDAGLVFIPLPIPLVSVSSQMVTFISRCDIFSSPQTALYYTQMGELICLAHFFGISDLHQDNLIPAAEGPQIADAECAFDQCVMTNEAWDKTHLGSALCCSFAPEGVANAVFTIEGAGLSTDHFREYAESILAGYDAALKVCTAMLATSAPLLFDAVRLIDQIRIVPYSTALLKDFFYGLHAVGVPLKPADFAGETDFPKATAALANDCLVDGQATLAINALCTAMNRSFENGDLPYFSLHRQPLTQDLPLAQVFLPNNSSAGYLYCDTTLIGRCNRFGPPPDFTAALALLTPCRVQLQQWLIPAAPVASLIEVSSDSKAASPSEPKSHDAANPSADKHEATLRKQSSRQSADDAAGQSTKDPSSKKA